MFVLEIIVRYCINIMPLAVIFIDFSLSLAVQGEIRACAFNQVAEKLNSTFEMGKVSV